MAKKETRVGTQLWETSELGVDIKKKVMDRDLPEWTNNENSPTLTMQLIVKSDCMVEVNGLPSPLTAGSAYNTDAQIYTLSFLTAGVEHVLSMTF